jgi:hypothetical protein
MMDHLQFSFLLLTFQFLLRSSHVFLLSRNIWFNRLISDNPRVLFPLIFNAYALLSILMTTILSTWPNSYNHFSTNSIKQFWTPLSLDISFMILSFFIFP